MEFFIRRATIDDASVVAPLFNAYRVFYEQEPDLKAAEAFINERLLQDESVIFIAFANDKAVGFTQLYPIFSSVSLRTAWLLNDLYVDANARGAGIATALLNTAKEFGRETNSKWLLLQTHADNITAQSVYEKNGWERVNDFFYEFSL